jgi:hypothetical protein
MCNIRRLSPLAMNAATYRPPPATDAATRRPSPATFPAKKKKDRSGHWGWPRSTPTARGRDPATLSGHICLREPKKKKKDPATGGGRDPPLAAWGGRNPPQRPGGERSGYPRWPFLSLRRNKKKIRQA